jgi:hypothetical protein
MIALERTKRRASDSTLHVTDVSSLSQQLSHRARAKFGVRSYTFNPWFHHSKEILVMAYILWEMVASISFRIVVLWSYLFCIWLWVVVSHCEKETNWEWGLHSSGMLHGLHGYRRFSHLPGRDVQEKEIFIFFFFPISTTLRTVDRKSTVTDKVERIWKEGCVNCFKISFRYLISGTGENQEQII